MPRCLNLTMALDIGSKTGVQITAVWNDDVSGTVRIARRVRAQLRFILCVRVLMFDVHCS